MLTMDQQSFAVRRAEVRLKRARAVYDCALYTEERGAETEQQGDELCRDLAIAEADWELAKIDLEEAKKT